MTTLPSGWTEVALGDICEFRYGKSLPAAKRSGSGHPVFGSNGQVGAHSAALTDGPTIVVGRKGSFGEVHWSDGPCWPIDTTYFIDSSATETDLRWLVHRLRGLRLTQLNRAAAIPGLNREDAYRRTLLLPPPEEQRRIAAILDKANELRAKRRAALDKLESLTQSIFLDMFGGTSATRWTVATLEDLSVDVRLGSSRKSGPSGRPALRIPNVKGGRLDLTDVVRVPVDDRELGRLRLDDGDLLFVRSNGNPDYVGRCAVFDAGAVRQSEWKDEVDEFVFASYLIRVRLDRSRVLPSFVETMMALAPCRRQLREAAATSAGQYNINSQGLGGLRVVIPPIDLQAEFVRRKRAVQSWARTLRSQRDQLEVLLDSLESRAFRGEL